MSRVLRPAERAIDPLSAIAEYISVASPVYAEQIVERFVARLWQAQAYPQSGRVVLEAASAEVRELIEPPCRIIYRVTNTAIEVVAIACTAGRK